MRTDCFPKETDILNYDIKTDFRQSLTLIISKKKVTIGGRGNSK